MASFNRIIMIGNLTRDPELKQLTSGQAVCRLGLASNRQFKNRQTGSMVQEVCYVDIDVWGAQAESCNQYLQKGNAVLVEGRLKFDTWEDPQGQNRSKHSIVADRVVFMPKQAQTEFASADRTEERTEETTPAAKSTVDEELEKELLSQIEEIKKRSQAQAPTQVKQKPQVQPSAQPQEKEDETEDFGGVEFKDQPPFEDDLPF